MGAHEVNFEEDTGIQRTNPRHRRSTDRRANGTVLSPTRFGAECADNVAGKMGSPKGKVGSVCPFFAFSLFSVFLSLSLSYTEAHTPKISFSLIHTCKLFLCLCPSLFPSLCLSLSLTCLPTPYLLILESLGGVDESLTQMSTSEGGSATSGNC